jgi:hypothetical protein
MKKRGRPTRQSEETQARICRVVAFGNSVECGAALSGVGRRTVFIWILRGEKEHRGPYHAFAVAYRKAQAAAEVRDVAAIRAAALAGTWQASAWLLERRHPERWARTVLLKHEHTGKNGGPIVKCYVGHTRLPETTER